MGGDYWLNIVEPDENSIEGYPMIISTVALTKKVFVGMALMQGVMPLCHWV